MLKDKIEITTMKYMVRCFFRRHSFLLHIAVYDERGSGGGRGVRDMFFFCCFFLNSSSLKMCMMQ